MTTPDYDTDFYAWTQAQAAALRAKDWAALDLAHLAEEVEDVGNSVRFALESHLVRLLLHLLKLANDPTARPRRGWRVTIANAREEIAKRATGALQRHPAAYLPDAYRQPAATSRWQWTGRWRTSPRLARGRSRRCWMRTFGLRCERYHRTEGEEAQIRRGDEHSPPHGDRGGCNSTRGMHGCSSTSVDGR